MSKYTIEHLVTTLGAKSCHNDWFTMATAIVDARVVFGGKGEYRPEPNEIRALEAAIRPWLGIKPVNGVLTR